MIRPALKATSSGVSVLPSWTVTPSRIWIDLGVGQRLPGGGDLRNDRPLVVGG